MAASDRAFKNRRWRKVTGPGVRDHPTPRSTFTVSLHRHVPRVKSLCSKKQGQAQSDYQGTGLQETPECWPQNPVRSRTLIPWEVCVGVRHGSIVLPRPPEAPAGPGRGQPPRCVHAHRMNGRGHSAGSDFRENNQKPAAFLTSRLFRGKKGLSLIILF